MGNNKHSRTAEFTAAIRAWHYLHGEHPLILEDPIAIDLLSPELRKQCLDGDKRNEFGRGGNAAIVIGRARYAEDKLAEAVRSGMNQYVILGAGGDSFALRRPDLMEKIRVFEIDRPGTQKWKRDRLIKHGHELPASLEFISADLEHETVLEALDRSSFRRDQRVCFSWLGTVMYLTPEAIFGTLRSFAKTLVAGSEVVFDYRVQNEFIDAAELEGIIASDKNLEAIGEPTRSFFNPYTFPGEIKAIGFDVVENLSTKKIEQRYLENRKDIVKATTRHWFAHIRL